LSRRSSPGPLRCPTRQRSTSSRSTRRAPHQVDLEDRLYGPIRCDLGLPDDPQSSAAIERVGAKILTVERGDIEGVIDDLAEVGQQTPAVLAASGQNHHRSRLVRQPQATQPRSHPRAGVRPLESLHLVRVGMHRLAQVISRLQREGHHGVDGPAQPSTRGLQVLRTQQSTTVASQRRLERTHRDPG